MSTAPASITVLEAYTNIYREAYRLISERALELGKKFHDGWIEQNTKKIVNVTLYKQRELLKNSENYHSAADRKFNLNDANSVLETFLKIGADEKGQTPVEFFKLLCSQIAMPAVDKASSQLGYKVDHLVQKMEKYIENAASQIVFSSNRQFVESKPVGSSARDSRKRPSGKKGIRGDPQRGPH